MSNAERYYNNMIALRTGKITADDARAFNATLRDEIGEAAYEQAKLSALTFDIRRNG